MKQNVRPLWPRRGFIRPCLSSAARPAAGLFLLISSYGGYVSDGIFLYNHIRGLPLRVVAHNVGSVTSIAVAVFSPRPNEAVIYGLVLAVKEFALPGGEEIVQL